MARKFLAKVGIVAVAFVLFATTSAQAQPEVMVDLTNTGGDLQLGGGPAVAIPAGNVGISGTLNTDTGAFAGTITYNPFSTSIDVPPPITANISVSGGAITGTIDPATGAANLSSSSTISLSIPDLSLTCTIGPQTIAWTSTSPWAPLPIDTTQPYTLALQGTTTINPLPADACSNPAITPIINDTLGLPATSTTSLPMEQGTLQPPETTTTAPTTTTTAAPTTTARATTTTPAFTG